jgi:hypothetical protein
LTKGETIYTLATANPKEQLMPFLSAGDRIDDESRDTASVEFTRAMMAAIVDVRGSR